MNDITIKIHAGTGRQTGESLCRSCQFAHIFVDRVGESVRCSMVGGDGRRGHPRGKVFECNDYYNKALPSLQDLYQTAWTLRTERGGKVIGFAAPEKDRIFPPASPR